MKRQKDKKVDNFFFLKGDKANGMYFVESGKLVVLKRIDGDEKEVIIWVELKWMYLWEHYISNLQVNELHKGEYFGELGLINHAPRQATISAREDVKVACKFLLQKCYYYDDGKIYQGSQNCFLSCFALYLGQGFSK